MKLNLGLRGLKTVYIWLRFGHITSSVVATAGDNVPAEMVFYGRKQRIIGVWAYGSFHPDYPYQG